MTKIVLNDLVNLENQTSAVNTINSNNAVIETAFDNTLSRDGTSPNQMGATLDMNSHQIINLPAPLTADAPLRYQDLSSFVGGGTVSNIPAGGAINAVLQKTSNLDFQIGWTNTPTFTGLTINPAAGANKGYNITQTGTGTLTSDFSYNAVTITDNLIQNSPSNFTYGSRYLLQVDGPAVGIGKIGLGGEVYHFLSPSNTTGDFIGLLGSAKAGQPNGGTNTGAGALGTLYGSSLAGHALSGATNYLVVSGGECNAIINTGGSSAHRWGLSIVGLGDLRGAQTDAALEISAAQASGAFKYGILFDSKHGGISPLPTDGVVLGTDGVAATITTGIDLSAWTMTNFLKGPGNFLVDGTANVAARSLAVSDGVVTGFFSASSAFTHSIGIGSTTNHPIAFLSNNIIAGYVATDQSWNFGSTGASQGVAKWNGITSGTVTVGVQAITGNYNFNLPIAAGTAGQVLTSQGGGATAMTWASAIVGSITLSGDVTGTGTNAITTVLATAQPAAHTWASSQTFSSAMVYGGVTLTNSVTGTGSMVLSASPTFTGTVTHPTPFTLGAVSVTTTGTQLNYLNAATGTTGTTSTNVVFSTSPSLTTPTIAGGTHTGITSLGIRDTSAAFDVTVAATSTSATLNAGRTLTLDVGNVAHTLSLGTTANTITFPTAASYTVAGLSIAQTFTAKQTISGTTNDSLAILGGTAGSSGGLSIGRTSIDGYFISVGSSSSFNPASVAGDTIVRGASRLLLDGSGGVTNAVIISATNAVTFPASISTPSITINGASQGLLEFTLSAANFNSTADQAIAITLPTGFTRYRIGSVFVSNPSTSLTTAAGGFYTAASKGGIAFVIAGTTYSTLTNNTAGTNGSMALLTVVNQNTAFYNSATLYLSLTTAQGSAATADVTLQIIPLP